MALSTALHAYWSDDLLWRQLEFCSLTDLCRSKRVDRHWYRIIKEMQLPSPWLSELAWKEWWMPQEASAQSSFSVIRTDLQEYPRRKYICLRGDVPNSFFFGSLLVGQQSVVTSDAQHVYIWNKGAQPVKTIRVPLLAPHALCLMKESNQLVITTPQHTGLFELASGNTLKTVESLGHSVFPLVGKRIVAVASAEGRHELAIYSTNKQTFMLDASEQSWSLQNPPHLFTSLEQQLHVMADLEGHTYIWKSGVSSAMSPLSSKESASYVQSLEKGKMVFASLLSKNVDIFDVHTSQKLQSYSFSLQTQPLVLPQQTVLLYSSLRNYASFVEMRSPEAIAKWSHVARVTGAVWSGYGPYVWTSCAEHITCWDIRMHKIVQPFTLRTPRSIQGRLDTGELVLHNSRAEISVLRWTGGFLYSDKNPKVKRKLSFPRHPG